MIFISNLKKYLIHFGIAILSIIIVLFSTTTLYYFNIISPVTYNILKYIFLLLILFINAFFLGKKAKHKGYLEGLKLGLFISIIFFLSTLFSHSFTLKLLIYYLIITITTSFGSMIGISRTKNN